MKKSILILLSVFVFLLSVSMVSADSCTDTESGADPTGEGGTVTLSYTNGSSDLILTDTCYDGSSRDFYYEYSCVDTSTSDSVTTTYYCDSCDSGRKCWVCSDSDGGLGYTTQGAVTITFFDLGESGVYRDSCSSSTMLRENYCSQGEVKSREYTCSSLGRGYMCNSGKCVSSPSRSSAGEYEEQRFFARLWAWLTGA